MAEPVPLRLWSGWLMTVLLGNIAHHHPGSHCLTWIAPIGYLTCRKHCSPSPGIHRQLLLLQREPNGAAATPVGGVQRQAQLHGPRRVALAAGRLAAGLDALYQIFERHERWAARWGRQRKRLAL